MKFLLCLLPLALVACSPNIVVVDESGAPIQGAAVIPMARSFSWEAKKTGKNGGVFVHQDIPRIENFRVIKPGYLPHPVINFDLPKPIMVTLRR